MCGECNWPLMQKTRFVDKEGNEITMEEWRTLATVDYCLIISEKLDKFYISTYWLGAILAGEETPFETSVYTLNAKFLRKFPHKTLEEAKRRHNEIVEYHKKIRESPEEEE